MAVICCITPLELPIVDREGEEELWSELDLDAEAVEANGESEGSEETD